MFVLSLSPVVAAAPTLKILQTDADLKWADVKTPFVRIPITIQNTTQQRVTGIRISVLPFSGSGRTAIDTKADPETIASLDKQESKTVIISATLLPPVTYRSIVTVSADAGTPDKRTIEIARTRGPAPVEISDALVQTIELGVKPTAATANFEIPLSGTGETASLNVTPKIVAYKRSATDTTATLARDAAINVASATPIALTNEEQQTTLKVDVTGIDQPGRYDATLLVGGGGFTSTPVNLTVYARQGWRVAAGWILAGVLLSLFLRLFGVVGRPSLLNKERANTLFRELDEAARLAADDAYALAVVQDVRRKLSDYWNGLNTARQLTNTTALDVYADKISLLSGWLQLRRRVKQLQPASLRKEFEEQLAGVESALRDRTADLEAVKAQDKVVNAMPTKIDATIKADLTQKLEVFIAEAEKDQRPQVRELLPLAGPIRGALEDDRLTEAAAALDHLQRRHIRILSDDLGQRIDPATPPVYVKPEDWKSATASIAGNLAIARNAGNATDASEAFRAALAVFLRVVINGLLAGVADHQAANNPTDYQKAKAPLDKALTLLDEGKLFDAWRELSAAEKLYRQAEINGQTALGADFTALANAVAGTPESNAGFDIVDVYSAGATADEVARPEAMATFKTLRTLGEILAFVAILAAAILFGLQTLWFGDPTWGGPMAWVKAFLWGVGFDQLSHAGLLTLIRRP